MRTQSIGMVGIGLMGQGIAYNILKAGYRLTVLDHPGNQPLDELQRMGISIVRSLSALVAEVEIVILCVTGAPQVEEIMTAPDGIVAHLRADQIVIDCSTSLPETSRRMAQACGEKGAHFLDAAMTRLPVHARAGTLNLLIGGEAALVESVKSLLDCFSESMIVIGPVGSGHLMKLLHNYVSIGMVALLGEVAAHATQAGLSKELLLDVLNKGGGGGTALQRISPYLLTGDAQSMAFTIHNAAKDLSYYQKTAEASDVAHVIAHSIASTLQACVDKGQGQHYLPELADLLKKLPEKN